MDRWVPESVQRWLHSTDDPWSSCERADWFIFVARDRECSVRSVVRALARNMPPIRDAADLEELTEPLRELIAACASAGAPSAALEETIRATLQPRITDWNIAHQYPSIRQPLPEGVRRATPAEEPVRASANAALRLWRALKPNAESERVWPPLALVAQHIVFERASSSRNPLYNLIDFDAASERERDVHREICEALRSELLAPAND
jgi:hypothetical protein